MDWLPPGLFLFWQPGAQIFLKNVKYLQRTFSSTTMKKYYNIFMGWLPPGLFLFWQPGAQIFLKMLIVHVEHFSSMSMRRKNVIIFLWTGYHLVYIYYWEPGPRVS